MGMVPPCLRYKVKEALMQKVAVLGAGAMGSGIAQVFAQAGFATCLFDLNESLVQKGRANIEAMLSKGVARGKLAAEEKEAALARLSLAWELEKAVVGVDCVVEAVPEQLALKQSLFQQVSALVSESTLLATNTSSLSIAELAQAVPAPQRFLGLHFFNPPPLMQLLEVVRGPQTTDEVVEHALALAQRLGKTPIVVRDAPGFASSRLGLALGLEAIRMVEEGVASPADIDTAMVLGYRHPMGPLQLTDLIGLDVRLHISEYLAATLDEKRFAPPALLRQMVAEGKLGKKSGQGFYRWTDGKIKDA